MTTLEILFSVLCPLLLLAWICAYASGRVWRNLATFWHQQATGHSAQADNCRRTHPLRECICRAGQRHGGKAGQTPINNTRI